MSEIKDYEVSFSLEINVDEAYRELRRLETLAYRTLSLIRRFGLPEDIEAAITRIQQLIAAINALRLALIAFEAAQGPVGWALAIVGGISAAFSFADVMYEVEGR